MIWQNLKIYLIEFQKLKTTYDGSFTFLQLIKFFPAWLNCLQSSKSPLFDCRPWITFSAIEFLEKHLSKNMKVFEYGLGGSTLFFAKRVEQVVSVEHEPEWYYQVSELLKENGMTNWEGHLIEPTNDELTERRDPSDYLSYVSAANKFKNKSFKNYVLSIDKYPDKYFDLVLIDGRARTSCLFHSLSKVKRGGYIILDNSDRDYYLKKTYELLSNFQLIDFPGPSPYVNFFTRTSVWQKLYD